MATLELQEVMKQFRMEQLQLSQLLERFPHYVMIVNAEDLTVRTVNPAYKQLLGSRNVVGVFVNELFAGQKVDQLINSLRKGRA